MDESAKFLVPISESDSSIRDIPLSFSPSKEYPLFCAMQKLAYPFCELLFTIMYERPLSSLPERILGSLGSLSSFCAERVLIPGNVRVTARITRINRMLLNFILTPFLQM